MSDSIGYDHGRDSDGSTSLGDLLRGPADQVVDPLSPQKVADLRRAAERLREAERQVVRALDHGSTAAQAAAIAACRQALHHLQRP